MAALPLPPPPRSQPIRVACRAPPPPGLKGLRPRVPGVGGSADGPCAVTPHGAAEAPRNAPAALPPGLGEALDPRPDWVAPHQPPPSQTSPGHLPLSSQTGPVLPRAPELPQFFLISPKLVCSLLIAPDWPSSPSSPISWSSSPSSHLNCSGSPSTLQSNQPTSHSPLNQLRPPSCSQSRPLPPHHLSVHPTPHSPSTPQGLDSGLAKALSLLYSPTAR